MTSTMTARDLGAASRQAVANKDKDTWLNLFAEDAVVQDPIGKSPFDPEGTGHRGHAAISAFYDTVIASSEKIRFDIFSSNLAGDEVADVGKIYTWLAGGTHVAIVHCVFTYRKVEGQDRLASLRAYWEFEKMELVEADAVDESTLTFG